VESGNHRMEEIESFYIRPSRLCFMIVIPGLFFLYFGDRSFDNLTEKLLIIVTAPMNAEFSNTFIWFHNFFKVKKFRINLNS
jgi:hypothetical protein